MANANPIISLCSVEGCDRRLHAKGMCSLHYGRWKTHGDPLKTKFYRLDPIANFWGRITKDGAIPAACPELGPCWAWHGPKTHLGYGHFTFAGKLRYAHIVSWFLATGEWPGNLDTLHRCDNPECANPGHLFLGSHADNMADRNQKKRHAHGERNGSAKLTESDVKEIRAARTAGATQMCLAAQYGVSRSNIRRIIDRKGWNHI